MPADEYETRYVKVLIQWDPNYCLSDLWELLGSIAGVIDYEEVYVVDPKSKEKH